MVYRIISYGSNLYYFTFEGDAVGFKYTLTYHLLKGDDIGC